MRAQAKDCWDTRLGHPAKGVTPLNTGPVRIGVSWFPGAPPQQFGVDALRLQEALLYRGKPSLLERVRNLLNASAFWVISMFR